jgi:uncharacterized protein (TIGR00255 family)
MIHSMTAFARLEERHPAGTLCWELRTVNHRYLEVTPRLPEEFRVLETRVRNSAAATLRRGKLDCQLRFQPLPAADAELVVDEQLAAQVIAAGTALSRTLENPARIDPLDILRWPGVLQTAEVDLEPARESAMALLERGLAELRTTREREGARIDELVRERCDAMAELVVRARERLPEVLAHHRQRLTDKLAELRAELDPERLEQEMALLANKLDVAEELDRLDAHLAEVRDVLARDEAVGRRLDFLMQELNREANTLGSKSADVETTRVSVELKVLIEQMREQVQNIE